VMRCVTSVAAAGRDTAGLSTGLRVRTDRAMRSAATVASPLTGSRFVRQTSRHTTSAERGTSQTQEGGNRALYR
jgi:hypothetical protein